MGMGGAVRILVVGTFGKEERPPQGQLWMEQSLHFTQIQSLFLQWFVNLMDALTFF